jgi:uncharacterized protein (TIGR02118 family)
MIKSTVLYGHPADPVAFEEHYGGQHAALVAEMPGVRRVETSLVRGGPDGSIPQYYRIAELWFDDAAAMGAAFGSSAGQATVADMENFATGGTTVIISEVD